MQITVKYEIRQVNPHHLLIAAEIQWTIRSPMLQQMSTILRNHVQMFLWECFRRVIYRTVALQRTVCVAHSVPDTMVWFGSLICDAPTP